MKIAHVHQSTKYMHLAHSLESSNRRGHHYDHFSAWIWGLQTEPGGHSLHEAWPDGVGRGILALEVTHPQLSWKKGEHVMEVSVSVRCFSLKLPHIAIHSLSRLNSTFSEWEMTCDQKWSSMTLPMLYGWTHPSTCSRLGHSEVTPTIRIPVSSIKTNSFNIQHLL